MNQLFQFQKNPWGDPKYPIQKTGKALRMALILTRWPIEDSQVVFQLTILKENLALILS